MLMQRRSHDFQLGGGGGGGGGTCRYMDTFRYVNTLTLGTIYNTARTYY